MEVWAVYKNEDGVASILGIFKQQLLAIEESNKFLNSLDDRYGERVYFTATHISSDCVVWRYRESYLVMEKHEVTFGGVNYWKDQVKGYFYHQSCKFPVGSKMGRIFEILAGYKNAEDSD